MAVPIVDLPYETRGFTCRVWFKEAIRCLHNGGFIYCQNVYALEEECRQYGLNNEASQPGWRFQRFVSCNSV